MTGQRRVKSGVGQRGGWFLCLCLGIIFVGLSPVGAAGPTPGGDALAEAQSLEKRGAYEEAAARYQELLAHSPSSTLARMGAGRTLAEAGRCDEAKDVLAPLEKSAGGEVEQELGVCYFRMHSFDLAVDHLRLAREAQPASPQACIFLARAYASAGDNAQAIAVLKAWLGRNPRDPDALYQIGKIYNAMSQAVLDAMIAKDPNNYLVRELEGEQWVLKQDYTKALAAYQDALRAAPDAPGGHFNVGDVYYRTLKYTEAQAELEKELKINPYHAQANFELGDIDIKQGRVEDGLPYLQRALQLDPALTDAHRSLARALLAEKRYADALEELLWVTKADPSDYTIHGMLARAYRQLGRTEDARREAEISQKLLQEHATNLQHLKAEEMKDNAGNSAPAGGQPH